MSAHPPSSDPHQPTTSGSATPPPASDSAAPTPAASPTPAATASAAPPLAATASASPTPAAASAAESSAPRVEPVAQSSAPTASPMRTVYHAPRRVVRIGIPDGWLRGLLAGCSAALMGWAVSTLLVIVTYMSVADNPWMGSVSWAQALSAGASLWALGLGGSLSLPISDDTLLPVRATPLLLTVLAVLSVRALVRSRRAFPASSYAFAVPGFIVVSAVFIGANQAWTPWAGTLVGATIISIIGVVWAACVDRRQQGKPSLIAGLLPPWGAATVRGIRAGALLTATLMGVAVAVLGVAAFVWWPSIAAIGELLAPASTLDTVMLVVAQILYLPNAVLWLLAWGSGAGIHLGGGAWHSLGEATVAPIPPIPLLGVMPGEAPGYGWLALPVVCSLVAGAVWGLRGRRASAAEDGVTAAAAVIVQGLLVGGLTALSTVSLGTGRLALMGPDPLMASLAVTGLTGVLVGVAFTLTHPDVRAWAVGMATTLGVGPSAPSEATTLNDSASDITPDMPPESTSETTLETTPETMLETTPERGDAAARDCEAQSTAAQHATAQDTAPRMATPDNDTPQHTPQPRPEEPRD